MKVALIGQPNTGKTSLFNKLTGSSQYVGNWPGVTIEKKEGEVLYKDKRFNIIDLPGVYSLSTYSMEETITLNYILNENPDIILNIVDATNLERNLYLTFQLSLINKPFILVLNMVDVANENGIEIDYNHLSRHISSPIVPVVARDGRGIDQLLEELYKIDINANHTKRFELENDLYYKKIEELSNIIKREKKYENYSLLIAYLFLIKDKEIETNLINTNLYEEIDRIREKYLLEIKKDLKTVYTEWIYSITKGVVRETVRKLSNRNSFKENITELIDFFVLNRYTSIPIFLISLYLLFNLTFILGDYFSGILERLINYIIEILSKGIGNDILKSLFVDGIGSGVGNVLSLLPYIFFMFFILSFLEDSGYMARVAFISDRFMHRIGLHGKSFIPLILGFGCSVPAMMSARTLENHYERVKTILMISFIPCSARVAVFVALIGAFFKDKGGIILFILYIIGILYSIFTGFLLSKTIVRKTSDGLIMELPHYHIPWLPDMLLNTWNKVKDYLVKAGSVILIASIIVWFLSYFPYGATFGGSDSYIGIIGKNLSFITKPLGFDISMTVGVISGIVAKEVIISTLAILNGDNLNFINNYPPYVIFSYLTFILLYIPCLATIITIKNETKSFKYVLFSLVYTFLAAWIFSFIITNAGKLIFSLLNI